MKNNDKSSPKRKYNVIIIALAVLIAVLAAGNIWAVFYRTPSFRNAYPLIDISRSFIPQEHFITNIESLRQELRELVQKEGPNSISLYFEYLNTGANISINPNLNIWPASLAKLPLAMVIMKKIEDGKWLLDNELVLLEQDKDAFSGNLYKNSIGTRFTIEALLRELLRNSDNTAYRILLRNSASEELAAIVNAMGLEELFTPEGRVSAKEYSRFFRSLYTSSFLERENSQKLLQWLSQSSFKDFLDSGLPDEIFFAHKFGENAQFLVFADSGIAYLPFRPYLLTVMIQGSGDLKESREKAQKLMEFISEKTYVYVANYQ